MQRDPLSRKLAVILHADVVESTLLVQKNETLAHQRIQGVFNRFSEFIQSFGGYTRELRGDALLAEFDRVSDAVCAALAFQLANTGFNSSLGDDIRPSLRIGISLGEVVVADNTITGAGVVLAQRLEQLAQPGGLIVQGSVADTMPASMPFEFDSIGEQELKGFTQPVRACTVRLRDGERLPPPDGRAGGKAQFDRRKTLPSAAAPVADEFFELPDKPSIAVLPFQNLSDDHEQEFFADGISEDIITVLSRIPDLVVIARNSTFVYKGRAVDVRDVGRELGVNYALEGSVQKAGERLRITAQLVDTRSGDHVWAERYDRKSDDVFLIQDEITRKIVVALSVKLTYGEEYRVWSDFPSCFETWELFQRGMIEQLKFTREGYDHAQRIAREMLDLEPELIHARVFLGWVLQSGARYGFASDPDAAAAEAERLVREVLAEEPNSADAHALLGYVLVNRCEHAQAIEHGERAIELRPGIATSHATLAISLFYSGEFKACLARMKKAIRLTGYPPDWFLAVLGDAYRSLGQLEKARAVFERLAARMPGSPMSLTRLISIYSDLDETDLGRQTAEALMSTVPNFTVGGYLRGMPFKNETDRQSLAGALIKAGLPE